MKRYGNLYNHICDPDNIRLAIKQAAKDHARDPAVIRMKENPDKYISVIHIMLINQSFVQSEYRTKTIYEHGKKRILNYTRTFPDRVIQHSLLQICGPILTSTYIEDTYASISGKGLHKANRKLKFWLDDDAIGTRYCLKIDVHHFFPSIDRDILYHMICRKIKDSRALDLFHQFIFDAPGTGIPIGNYLSQYLSNYYLSGFDHYCKERLHVKYYMRYMDDVIVLSNSKIVLRSVLHLMSAYLSKLHLEIKSNWQIFPVDARGIDFLGFVFYHNHIAIRKRVKLSYIRSVNSMIASCKRHNGITNKQFASHNSYLGMLKWCDAKHLSYNYEHRLEGYVDGILC